MKTSYFSFWDSICFNRFICNKNKRNFVLLASNLINKKISIEHLLKISNNLEKLKDFILDEEKAKEFNELPVLPFEKQLTNFDNL